LGERARRFGFRGEMKLIPNGVDVKSFELRDFNLEERNKIRRGWGFGDRDTVLITSSRLNIKNGIGDVIEALVLLPENVKFVICGIGELRESLELRAKSLKVGDRVIFVGNISHDLLPKYLKSADIFIRPSLSEGFGLSFVEAMATRLPVIATRVGGIADFLVDPAKLEQSEMRSGMEVQTGYVCEPQNPESVAKTVQRVINDVGRNRIIENAYRMVKEKYDWDLIAGKMKEVFGSSI
jgi:glycosyltransferase involved in cell wall biosynthesis